MHRSGRAALGHPSAALPALPFLPEVRTMKTRFLALAVATTAVIGGGYLLQATNDHGSAVATNPSGPALAQSSEIDRHELDRLIEFYEHEVQKAPTTTGLTFLGQMYLQRGRLTGDVQTYVQAAAAAERAVSLAPRDRTARTLAAGIRYTTHDFAGAEHDAQVLVAERPDDVGSLAVLGDAQLELGDYAAAAATYGGLRTASPDAAAASVRSARLAFIQGRLADADRLSTEAKRQAVASAFGDAGLAYYSVFKGQLDLD